MSAAQLETALADLVFGTGAPVELDRLGREFTRTDRRQFSLFHARLLRRLEERLSSQFGACLGLLEETRQLPASAVARAFAASAEFRKTREDLSPGDLGPSVSELDSRALDERFEVAFLCFVTRVHAGDTELLGEFNPIYLHELQASMVPSHGMTTPPRPSSRTRQPRSSPRASREVHRSPGDDQPGRG